MNDIKALSHSFDTTIKNSNLKNITIDLTEAITDSVLKDGLLKEIPIIGTILNLSKLSLDIKDQLFMKKIISFITEIKDISEEKRNRMISEIDSSENYKIKVGEKLLFIIDKCEDYISAEYIAKFFKAFLKNKISYSEFLRCSSIIQNIFLEDFQYFLKNENLEYHIKTDEYFNDIDLNLINAGLCGKVSDEFSIRDQEDWEINKYVVEGGGESLYITDIGKKIKEILE